MAICALVGLSSCGLTSRGHHVVVLHEAHGYDSLKLQNTTAFRKSVEPWTRETGCSRTSHRPQNSIIGTIALSRRRPAPNPRPHLRAGPRCLPWTPLICTRHHLWRRQHSYRQTHHRTSYLNMQGNPLPCALPLPRTSR